MPQAASPSPGIFICYRRDDTAGHAGRLYDCLTAHFGDGQTFMDRDLIEPGDDFVQVIEEAVGSCNILLALIGRNWLASRDEVGWRLDNSNDYVRLEISAALARGIRVIPVLVQGARMPCPGDLPEDLLPLSRRHALELSDLRWKHDVDQLLGLLEKVFAPQRKASSGVRSTSSDYTVSRSITIQQPVATWAVVLLAVVFAVLIAELFVLINLLSAVPMPPVVERPRASPKSFTNSAVIEFVWVPPGGLPGNADESGPPVPRVTFDEGFYISKHEVTQAQWQALMGSNPNPLKGSNQPVEGVSWDDARDFIALLNARRDGYKYRLPSEAEWEYVTLAGMTTDSNFGFRVVAVKDVFVKY